MTYKEDKGRFKFTPVCHCSGCECSTKLPAPSILWQGPVESGDLSFINDIDFRREGTLPLCCVTNLNAGGVNCVICPDHIDENGKIWDTDGNQIYSPIMVAVVLYEDYYHCLINYGVISGTAPVPTYVTAEVNPFTGKVSLSLDAIIDGYNVARPKCFALVRTGVSSDFDNSADDWERCKSRTRSTPPYSPTCHQYPTTYGYANAGDALLPSGGHWNTYYNVWVHGVLTQEQVFGAIIINTNQTSIRDTYTDTNAYCEFNCASSYYRFYSPICYDVDGAFYLRGGSQTAFPTNNERYITYCSTCGADENIIRNRIIMYRTALKSVSILSHKTYRRKTSVFDACYYLAHVRFTFEDAITFPTNIGNVHLQNDGVILMGTGNGYITSLYDPPLASGDVYFTALGFLTEAQYNAITNGQTSSTAITWNSTMPDTLGDWFDYSEDIGDIELDTADIDGFECYIVCTMSTMGSSGQTTLTNPSDAVAETRIKKLLTYRICSVMVTTQPGS